jgi:hypothetical protein
MLSKMIYGFAVLSVLSGPVAAIAEQTAEAVATTEMRAQIAEIFPDRVLDVPRNDYDAMFAKTEAFFATFSRQGEAGHALIRAAIREDGHPNFFYYRAAGFLFDLEKPSSPDAVAALAGLERVSPYTVNNQWYLMTANYMAGGVRYLKAGDKLVGAAAGGDPF